MAAATSEALSASVRSAARGGSAGAGGGVCCGCSSAWARRRAALDVWPRGGTPAPEQPTVKVAAPPRPGPPRLSGPVAVAGLLAALPAAAGVAQRQPGPAHGALTFDDGPSGRTPAILRVLAHHHAHATSSSSAAPARHGAAAPAHDGHRQRARRSHLSHADLLILRKPKRAQELRWTAHARGEGHRLQPRFFRPPYGATGTAVNRLGRRLGLVPCCGRSTAATGSSGTKAIVRRVLANVSPVDRPPARRRRRPPGDAARAARDPARAGRRHLRAVTL